MRSRLIPAAALVLLLSVVCLAACVKRDKDCCAFPAQAPLAGKWSLKLIYGGFAGASTYIPADAPIYLTLNNDSTYSVHQSFFLVESGSYHLCDTPVYSSIPQRSIVFTAIGTANRYVEPPTSLLISHDSLFLGSAINDNIGRIYVKVN
jgi:hypothetical protein